MAIRISDAFKRFRSPAAPSQEPVTPAVPEVQKEEPKTESPPSKSTSSPKLHFLMPGPKADRLDKPIEPPPDTSRLSSEPVSQGKEQQILKALDSLYRQILLNFREAWWHVAGGKNLEKEHYLFFHTQLTLVGQVLSEYPEVVTAVIFRAKRPETYLITHSMNVCFLAVAMAVIKGLPREEVTTHGLAGLLHDIGMARIDESIYMHEGPLTSEQQRLIRQHPTVGAELLRATGFVCEEAITVAENSHELLDGTGYPRGLKDEDLSDLSRMIRTLDSFDSLIQPRVYRHSITQHAAMMQLIKERQKICQVSVKSLIDSLTFYPVGSIVRLDSGELAVVRRCNRALPTRPRIEIFVGSDGRRFHQPKVEDLASIDFYTIRDVLTPEEAEQYIKKRQEIAAAKEKDKGK